MRPQPGLRMADLTCSSAKMPRCWARGPRRRSQGRIASRSRGRDPAPDPRAGSAPSLRLTSRDRRAPTGVRPDVQGGLPCHRNTPRPPLPPGSQLKRMFGMSRTKASPRKASPSSRVRSRGRRTRTTSRPLVWLIVAAIVAVLVWMNRPDPLRPPEARRRSPVATCTRSSRFPGMPATSTSEGTRRSHRRPTAARRGPGREPVSGIGPGERTVSDNAGGPSDPFPQVRSGHPRSASALTCSPTHRPCSRPSSMAGKKWIPPYRRETAASSAAAKNESNERGASPRSSCV